MNLTLYSRLLTHSLTGVFPGALHVEIEIYTHGMWYIEYS